MGCGGSKSTEVKEIKQNGNVQESKQKEEAKISKQDPIPKGPYKLTYFDGQGRAELTRVIFASQDIKFEDIRVNFKDWPDMKPTTPMGMLPILEVEGTKICESQTIARTAAHIAGIAGETDLERAQADMIVDNYSDMLNTMLKWMVAKDPSEKEECQKRVKETIPVGLANIEKILVNNGGVGFIVGSKLTWADIACMLLMDDWVAGGFYTTEWPTLARHAQRIREIPAIAKWILGRPKMTPPTTGTPSREVTPSPDVIPPTEVTQQQASESVTTEDIPEGPYKLTYFNLRGRAELTRMIFASKGIEYEDIRVEFKDWPEVKPTTPRGYLPLLEVGGVTICESQTVARTAAHIAGIAGETELERAQADMIIDCYSDIFDSVVNVFFEKDLTTRNELIAKLKTQTPEGLKNLEKILVDNDGGDGFIVGSKLTWADIACMFILDILHKMMPEAGVDLDMSALCPQLTSHSGRICGIPAIAKWIDERPAEEPRKLPILQAPIPKGPYKLTYFNLRGRAELTRMIFASKGIEYEDIRVEFKDWPEVKPTTPRGYLPLLEAEGVTICESQTIARTAAHIAGIAGETELERAQADMIIDCYTDIFDSVVNVFFEKDLTTRNELIAKLKTQTPEGLKNLEKILVDNDGGDGFIVGSKLTWADIACMFILDILHKMMPEAGVDLDMSALCPQLMSHSGRICGIPAIAKWIDERPAEEPRKLPILQAPIPKGPYKLTYFDIRGRAELTRMIFASKDIEFEDIRVDFKDWPDMKPTTPNGVLPLLEVEGATICESQTIARTAAHIAGIAGTTEEERGQADMCVDCYCDAINHAANWLKNKDDEEKGPELLKNLTETQLPTGLENLQKILVANGGDGFIVGNELTWADLACLTLMEEIPSMLKRGGVSDAFDCEKYTELSTHAERIREIPAISNWIQKRPQSARPA